MQLASGSSKPTGLWKGNASGSPVSLKNFVFTPLA